MDIINFIKDYWVLISCVLVPFLVFCFAMVEGIKCSLRNDILAIYNDCKRDKKITQFELDAILHSYRVYKLLRGNSFVEQLVAIVKTFEIID